MENQETSVETIDFDKFFTGNILENKEVQEPTLNFGNNGSLFGETTPTAEETTVIVADTSKVVETEDTVKDDTKFSEFVSSYFGDVEFVEIVDSSGEITKIKPSDLSAVEITELIKQEIQAEIDEATKDKISTKGLSEIVSAIVEVDKSGGDITKLLQVQEKVVSPLQGIDLGTEEGQRKVVLLDLSLKAYSEKDARDLVELWESKGELEDRARIANESIESAIQSLAESEKVQAIKEQEERKKAIKGYKIEVKKGLEQFTLKDTFKSKLVDTLSQSTPEGKFRINDLFLEALQNPVKAGKLALFLEDEEEYNRQVSSKKVIEEKLKDGRTLRLQKRETTQENTPAKNDSDVISFENL